MQRVAAAHRERRVVAAVPAHPDIHHREAVREHLVDVRVAAAHELPRAAAEGDGSAWVSRTQ